LSKKWRKKLDGLDFFIEEANVKIAEASKKVDFLEKVDQRLEDLKGTTSIVEEKILDLTKEKKALDDQEKRMSNLTSKLSIMEVELRSKFADIQEAKEEINGISVLREELTACSDSFERKIESVNKENIKLDKTNQKNAEDECLAQRHTC